MKEKAPFNFLKSVRCHFVELYMLLLIRLYWTSFLLWLKAIFSLFRVSRQPSLRTGSTIQHESLRALRCASRRVLGVLACTGTVKLLTGTELHFSFGRGKATQPGYKTTNQMNAQIVIK